MKNYLSIIGVAVGMTLLLPTFAFAEETTGATDGTTNTSADGTVNPPSGVELRESPTKQSTGALRESPTLPSKGVVAPRDAASGLPTGKRQYAPVIIKKEIDKATPKLLEAKAPRDAASGQATGKMMASGTKPLLEKREEAKEKMEEKREEMREKIREKRGEILKRMAHKMIERMEAAIERLVKLADRVESRITKLKEKGVDTTKSEGLLALTRTKLDEAKDAVEAAKESIETAIAAANAADLDGDGVLDKPADPGKTVRDLLSTAQEAVKAAHKALVDAIASLRVGDGKVKTGGTVATGTGTSTP